MMTMIHDEDNNLTAAAAAAAATASSRKYHDKEAFVTGHSGATPLEPFLICFVIPFGLELYYRLHAWYCCRRQAAAGSSSSSSIQQPWWKSTGTVGIILEFVTLVIPMLLVQTSLLPNISGPLGLVGGMIVLMQMFPNPVIEPPPLSAEGNNQHHRISFLSIHRACVYLLTTIAILAVDFPLFPRRYCKTEVSGYGWMDLGAASFIIIAGWTSALSNSPTNKTHSNNEELGNSGGDERTRNTTSSFKASGRLVAARKAIMKCGPLLMIGLIRLATNKGLEYQEHVSEYGVHWNFFFTLCLVEGSMVLWKGMKHTLLRSIATITNTGQLDCILGILIMVPYQLFLSYYGGQEFIVDGSRRCNAESYGDFLPAWFISDHPFLCNFFVANREGILGVFGYLSLRLFSEAISRQYLVPFQEVTGDVHDREVRSYLQKYQLFYLWIALWALLPILVLGLDIPTSRRSTNASFILWALVHNTQILWLIAMFMSETRRAPPLLEAVNRFGLAVFLSSNILTGLVNLTFDTLHTSNGMAVIILMVYLMLVCGFALFLGAVTRKKKKMMIMKKKVDPTLKVD